MQYISARQAQEFKNDVISSREYVFPEARLNLAPITINGRYPETHFTENKVVDSVVYILDGEGVIGIKDGNITSLLPGDQIYITKGDGYYFQGNLEILYAATPPWTPEQTAPVK